MDRGIQKIARCGKPHTIIYAINMLEVCLSIHALIAMSGSSLVGEAIVVIKSAAPQEEEKTRHTAATKWALITFQVQGSLQLKSRLEHRVFTNPNLFFFF